MKRILVIVLSLIMVLTMIPAMATTAFGATGLSASLLLNNTIYTGTEYSLQSLIDTNLLTVQYNGTTLTKTDYQISWKDPNGDFCTTAKNVGTYRGTITYTPSGSSQLSTYVDFRVDKINMGIADFAVKYNGPTELSNATYSNFATLHNGGDMGAMFDKTKLEIKQAGVLLNNDFFEAKATKINDYQFSILLTSLNPNVWSYPKTVVVSLTKDFGAFKIVGTAYNSDYIADVIYTGQEQKPAVYVVPVSNATGVKSGMLALNTDYTLSYSSNINAADGKATVTATPKPGSRYGGTTITKTFNIKPKDLKYAVISTPANSLNGEAPLFTVTDGTKNLVENVDYEIVTYGFVSGSTNQGELKIKGKAGSNYTGEKTARYTIASYSITSADVEQEASGVKTFTGSVLYPNMPRLKYMNGVNAIYLNQNSDYVLEYRYGTNETTNAPKDAKQYTVYALGRGQYGGSRYVGTFTIAQIPFIENTGVNITVTRGANQTAPAVTVKTLSGVALTEGKDYTFTETFFSKELGRGSVRITSTGAGNLTAGTITKDYVVASKSLPPAYFYEYSYGTGYTSSYSKTVQWTGSSMAIPTVRVMDGSSLLTQGLHYTVSVKNSLGQIVSSIKDTGVYTILVSGMGMYTGNQTLTFTVKGVDISNYLVTLSKVTENATGGNISLPSVLSVKDGYKTLSSSDYTVSYLGTDGKATSYAKLPGEYTVVVTGRGGYEGTAKATFKLVGETQTVSTLYTKYTRLPGAKTFNLNAKASANGKLTFTTSDASIATVDSLGNVTIGNKVGVVKIIIKSDAIGKYDVGNKEVIITVKPNKGVVSKATSPRKGQLKVWFAKQNGVEKYQISVSRTADFSTASKVVNIADKAQYKISQSGKIKNLGSGTYYVRVRRAYTNASGTTSYGKWSTVKKVNVK